MKSNWKTGSQIINVGARERNAVLCFDTLQAIYQVHKPQTLSPESLKAEINPISHDLY